MPWSGPTFNRTNGTYSGAAVWQSDASASVKIRADRHDIHDKDLADGINACLNKNGLNSPTANISWGGFKITSLAAGTANGEAVIWEQIVPATGGTYTGAVTFSAGLTSSTDVSDSRGNLRDIPPNVQNAAYTFALADRGRCVVKTDTTARTWTIPLESTTAFPDGTAITAMNDGASANVTISPAGGVTLLDGATSGSFALLPNVTRTLYKVPGVANRWRVI